MKKKVTPDPAGPTDTERLAWCLRYGHAKTLGSGARDFDYLPLTRDLIDKAIARERRRAAAAQK